MSNLRVHSLFHYPVKSCAPITLQRADIDASGIVNDRRWMIVDGASGKFVTQRKDPKLARIKVKIENGILALHYMDGMSSFIDVPISQNKLIETEVWKDRQLCWDQGEQVASWLSDILGKEVRLAYIGEDQLRTVDQDYAKPNDQVGFADGFPFLITTTASIEQFNRDLGYEVSVLRFRPNIVIEGAGLDAYAEDNWTSLSINGIQFDLVKPCSRCVMPSINPETIERERAVIETLVATRKQGNATFFGQNATHSKKKGVISVGDKVTLI
ncbi:MOSC domain-containing protein [Litoribrevibacter euphylliae]|uniref:MOSC domain-containing protein n=1 Tax=Litoribrevibacter euphylliae TaxID=1834034 RepID=A0ABV7HKJ8_9GAMM